MSYYEWVKTFEMLKNSPMDDNIIKNLENKKLDGNNYVLERFIDHVINTVNTRLNNSCFKCIDNMLSRNSDINTLSIELVNLKKEKDFVLKMVSLPVFEGELGDTFKNVINEKYEEIYNVIKRNIQYIDTDGMYISTFEKIMLTNTEG